MENFIETTLQSTVFALVLLKKRYPVDMKYKRILLKISGEALLGDQQFGIDQKPVKMIAEEIQKARELGAEVAVVVGGGNTWNGSSFRRLCRNACDCDECNCFAKYA